MYFIKDTFTLINNESSDNIFDFKREFEKHDKPFNELNNSIKCYKYCKINDKIVFVNVDVVGISMMSFDCTDDNIKYLNKHVHKFCFSFKRNISLNNSFIIITNDCIVVFVVNKLNEMMASISFKTCCFELIEHNPKYKVLYSNILTSYSMSICNSMIKHSQCVYHRKEKVEIIKLADFGFIKISDFYIFVVNYKPYIFYDIEFVNISFDNIIFGYKHTPSIVTYYEVHITKFSKILEDLIDQKVSFDTCTKICTNSYEFIPIDTYISI